MGGAQEYFSATPDLAVFAKGIANGMPVSAYCGKREIMERLQDAIVSSTYGGETLSLAAVKASVTTYKELNVIDHLWKVGTRLRKGFNEIAAQNHIPISAEGFPPCPALVPGSGAPTDIIDRLFRACFKNGLSIYSVLYVNFSHSEQDIDEALTRLETSCKGLL